MTPDHEMRSPHPLDELMRRDDVLVHAKQDYPEVYYLNTPPIEVMGKARVVDLAGSDAAYLFRLNHLSDTYWEALFTKSLRGVRAQIQGAQLEILCTPEALERSYNAVKQAIENANEGYARLRSELLEQISARDAASRARNDVHTEFDELEL